ncbi:hypothetical protein GE061_019474 [Apolygus lucorum]|uniref:Nose resistant-to-fluoxetine protein N-terminal domain-containing protein n=1 Tax=Apolygus lucorum TaxID=248454 RepID=A0A6A4JR67_APOLU|nr:hypothetical protein GE061_019474 [Apolygus lucorum]
MFRISAVLFTLVWSASCQKNNGPFKVSIVPSETTPAGEYRTLRLSGDVGASSNSSDGGVGRQSTLDRLLDVYNPQVLAGIWNRTEASNSTCHREMGTFLEQLEARRLWAIRVADASGRYGGGFFWGNDYWMGSSTHCHHITDSPFPLDFFVFKTHIKIDSSLSPNYRSLLVGVCLPRSCQNSEAEDIVKLSSDQLSIGHNRTVLISAIKTPHNAYYMTSDPVFWLLVIVTIAAGMLVAAGTFVDLYEEHMAEKRKKSKYVYDNYTYEVAKASQEVGVKVSMANNNENSEAESSDRNSVDSDDLTNGIWRDVVLSFSAKRNLKTICESKVGEDTISTIHGLRSISMAWVILGHTCISAFRYSDNTKYRAIAEAQFMFQTINNGAYSVDTFFFISGLLVSFLYFRTTAKVDVTKLTGFTGFLSGVMEFIGMFCYRFARLTAPYFYVMGIVLVSMRWFHHNSLFETPTNDYVNCELYWWRNLLYINTLFPVQDMCMLWSWYLSDDTQFFVLGSILLILAVKHFRIAFSCMVVFLVSSWITTAMIAYDNNHIPNSDDPLALFDKIYDKPWTRLGPYLIGMSVGWILFKTDCKIRMTKMTVAIGWVLSSSTLLFLIYGLYNSKLSPITAAAFSSLSHTAWALGLAWIVIACSVGYGGYITKILSSSFLYPFSRVTYCAYLIHPVVIRSFTMTQDSPIHLGVELVTLTWIGHLVVSYALSFVISILFEAPSVSLLRIVSPTKRRSKAAAT